MLEVGKRYTSPRTRTWLEVTERADGNMKFERSFAPGTGSADPHLHQDLTQTWEGLSGEGMIEVDGEEREFRTGDRVAIPPRTLHLTESGRLDDQDEMPLLQIYVTSQATNGCSWAGSPPIAVQKASLPLLAAIGGLRGYRPSYD